MMARRDRGRMVRIQQQIKAIRRWAVGIKVANGYVIKGVKMVGNRGQGGKGLGNRGGGEGGQW